MTRQHYSHTVGMLCLVFLLLLSATNCSKDFSFEGGPLSDTTSIVDTSSDLDFFIPSCPSCSNANEVKVNSWKFSLNGTVICGVVTRAIKNAAGTALTFFGPSQCSQDTGVVITAYFTAPGLTENKTPFRAERVGLEYYDKVTPSSIVLALLTTQFSLIIQTYNQQSGEATGIFEGEALTSNGKTIKVTSGKFNIKIE